MVIQGYWLPIIHAKIELNRKNPAAAVEMLQVTAPLEMNQEGGFYANYLRGEAFLRLRKGREAAAEFQKLLDHRALAAGSLWVLSHLQLGRAYKLQDDTAEAKAAYQDLERCRLRYSHLEAGQDGIRESDVRDSPAPNHQAWNCELAP
jgi:predicted Zn-dependent protease